MICKRSAIEAGANTVLGIMISILVNLCFGIPIFTTLALTCVYVITSNMRAYGLRVFFKHLWNRIDARKN